VTPAHTSGRIVAVAVMLWGIAFVAIVVAAITSTFVARAAGKRDEADAAAEQNGRGPAPGAVRRPVGAPRGRGARALAAREAVTRARLRRG